MTYTPAAPKPIIRSYARLLPTTLYMDQDEVRRTQYDSTTMNPVTRRSTVFVNMTRPSQPRDDHVKRMVKAYTTKHNMNQKSARHKVSEKYSSSPSSDEEDNEADSDKALAPYGEAAGSNPIAHSENDPLPDEISESEDLDVEDIPGVELDDVFPNVGNLVVPYLGSGYGVSGRKRLLPLVQLYFEVFGSSHLWGSTLTTVAARMQFKRYVFQTTMTDPAVLETAFALAQARLDREIAPNAPRSWAVSQHRGHVLRSVQEELVKSPEDVSEATLWDVADTIEGDVTFSDWSSFRTNMIGARRIIALKGITDNLSGHGWFQMFFAWAELRWTMHISCSCCAGSAGLSGSSISA